MLIARNGRTVTLNGYFVATIQGATTLFQIDEEFRPLTDVRGICNVGPNAYSVNTMAYVSVGRTGNVQVNPPNSNSYSVAFMSLAWTV